MTTTDRDLVERLRKQDVDSEAGLCVLCDEAANEIERLRKSGEEQNTLLAGQLAATASRAERAEAVIRQAVEAYDSGNLQLNSPELDGDIESGIPPHPWHEEWLYQARQALTAYDKDR